MDLHFLQKPSRNSLEKIILSQHPVQNKERLFTGSHIRKRRNCQRGFIELEMLVWTVVIASILGGFFHIHKSYYNRHLKLQKEFSDEWKNFR